MGGIVGIYRPNEDLSSFQSFFFGDGIRWLEYLLMMSVCYMRFCVSSRHLPRVLKNSTAYEQSPAQAMRRTLETMLTCSAECLSTNTKSLLLFACPRSSATFETGDPAISFSRYKGMARGPNSGVAQRHDLVDR
jgi:hypothetical protein